MSGIRQRAVKGLLGDTEEHLTSLEQQVGELERRVDTLTEGLEESRRLNERLSDVLDVVAELLVPAVNRDDERLQEALGRLGTMI